MFYKFDLSSKDVNFYRKNFYLFDTLNIYQRDKVFSITTYLNVPLTLYDHNMPDLTF